MRAVIQRVKEACVSVDGNVTGQIEKGLLVLVGVEDADTDEDIEWLTKKIAGMRIFDDENGVMNLSVMDIDGRILAVSQFTLFGSTKKGNRPSWIRETEKGIFGADMKVSLLNDGPVTIIMDTKNKE